METKAIRGLRWTFLSYGSTRLVQTVATVVLARLLVPEDFGIVTLATIVIAAVSLLSDFGLGGLFVLRQDLDDRAAGTVCSLMAMMGVFGGVVVTLSAPLVGWVFGEPRVAPVLRLLALTIAIGGISWFYEVLLQRRLEFGRVFAAKALQTVTQASMSIGLAVAGWDVWSIVGGILAGSTVYSGALLLLVRERVRLRFDPPVARGLLRSGRGFLAQGGLKFLEYNFDSFAVGSALNAVSLGYYSMAYRLADQTYWAIADPIGRVAFPAFARMRQRGDEVASSYLDCLRFVALLACPLGAMLSATAAPFTTLVFGPKWSPMATPLAILGLWAAVRPLHSTMEWFLSSLGHAATVAKAAFVLFAIEAPSLLLAAALRDITAVASVMLAHAILSVIVLTTIIRRRAHVGLAAVLSTLRSILAGSVVAWTSARITSAVLADAGVAGLVGALGAAMATFVLVVHLLEPGMLQAVVTWVGGVDRGGDSIDSPSAEANPVAVPEHPEF